MATNTPAWTFVSVPDMFNADYADISGGLDPAIAAVFDGNDVDYTDGLIGAPNWQPGDDNSMNVALAQVWKTNTELMVQAAGGNPDLVAIAGDLTYARFTQHIQTTRDLFGGTDLDDFDQTLNDAFAAYYSWMRKLWEEAGVGTVVAAIGDHEIGDNNWPSGPRTDFVPAMKEAFGEHMVDPLGIAPTWNGVSAFAPEGDGQYDEGSYVYQNKNVLFLTVDVFKFSATGGLADGGVEASVDGAHLQWINDILDAAEADASVDHVIVQGHVPVLTPVNSIRSSRMTFEGGENSAFWQALQDHGTNNGGKVRAYLNGEVHATTVIEDASSGIVQISHGATNQADGAAQLDPYFMTFEVTPTGITGKEFTIVNDNLDTSDTVWEAHRTSSQTVDFVGAMTEIGTIEIDVTGGVTALTTTGNLEAPIRTEGHQDFVGGPGDDAHAGGIDGAGFTQNNQMFGRGGNDDLDGRGGTDQLFGEEGNDTLDGGDGTDLLVGGVGDDSLTGGSGANTFRFAIGDGADAITDFKPGTDQIEIGVAGFGDLTITQDGADALVGYDGGEIRFEGVDQSALVPGVFGFEAPPVDPLDPIYVNAITLATPGAPPAEPVRDMAVGVEPWADRTHILTDFPSELLNGRLIVTNNDDKGVSPATTYLSFTAIQDAFVYVGIDQRVATPSWLDSAWTKLPGQITGQNTSTGSNLAPFDVWGRAVATGETVTTGGNGNGGSVNSYFVIVDDSQLFTSEDAPMLDTQILLQGEDGVLTDPNVNGSFNDSNKLTQTGGIASGGEENDAFGLRPGYSGEGYIDFGGAGDSLEFTFDSPVAGAFFELHIRYASNDTGAGARTTELSVNGGAAETVAYPQPVGTTGGEQSFDTWRIVTVPITLVEGQNTINMTLTGSGPNVDALVIANAGEAPDFGPAFTTLPVYTVAENQTAVGTVGAADVDDDFTDGVDTASAVTFEITGGADQALFSIDETTGALTFDAAPDFEAPDDDGADNTYDLFVTVTDAGGNAAEQAITVSVIDVDPELATPAIAPIILQAEDAALDTDTATTLQRTQAQNPEDNSGGKDAFGIWPNYGGAGYIDFNGDGAGVDGAEAFTLQVTVPEAGLYDMHVRFMSATTDRPVDVGINGVTQLSELSFVGAGFDGDAWIVREAVTLQLETGVNTITFAIPTGFNNGPNVDAIAITSFGAAAPAFPSENTAPGFDGAPTAADVAEGATAVASLTVADDGQGNPAFALTGDDADLFEIDSNGALAFKTAPDFEAPADAGADGVYNVTVGVSDEAGGETVDIAVTVTDVDEAPTLTGAVAPATLPAGGGVVSLAGLTATDPEEQPTTLQLATPLDGFSIDGTDLTVADTVAAGDYTVAVVANDGGLDSETVQISVTVEEAVIEDFETIVIQGEDLTVVAGGGDPSLVRTQTSNQEKDGLNGFGQDVPGGNTANPGLPQYDDYGLRPDYTGDGYFDINGNLGAKATVEIPDLPLGAGSYDVYLRVANGSAARPITVDIGGVSERIASTQTGQFYLWGVQKITLDLPEAAEGPRVLTISTEGSNGPNIDAIAIVEAGTPYSFLPPAITSPATLEIVENNLVVGVVSASDLDQPTTNAGGASGFSDEALTFAILDGQDGALFSIDAATGELSFVAAPDFEAGPTSFTLTVEVSDGALTTRQEITVNVLDDPSDNAPDNTLPTAVNGVGAGAEDAPVIAIDIADLIDDLEDGEPTITAATSANGTVAINGTVLEFTPAADFNGDAIIDYTVADTAGDTASAQVTVTVAPVNDAPTLSGEVGPATVTTDGGVVDLSGLIAADIDGPAPTLAVRAAGGAAAPDGVVVNGDGDLVIPAGLALGELALEIVANDGEFDSERVVPITVTVEEPVDLSYTVPADGEIVIQLENRDGSITILDEDVDGGGVNNSDLTQFRDSANPELNGDGSVQQGAGKTDGLWDGKTGEGYLDMGGDVGDAFSFVVNAPAAGDYAFAFRYNNGSGFNGGERPLAIAVGGAVQATPSFARGATWTDWLVETVTLTLEAGENTISVANTVANGPNLDQVAISAVDASADSDETPLALTGPETVAAEARNAIAFTVVGRDADIVKVEISFDGGATRIDVTDAVDENGVVTVDGSALETGDQTATVVVTDAAGNEADATFDFTVDNAAPTADNGVGAGAEDAPVIAIDIADLIDDLEDGEPTITAATSANGTVAINGTVLEFTPAADFNGDAIIDYTVADTAGDTASAQVTVTVAPVNDAPTLSGEVGPATVTTDGGVVDLSGLIAADIDGPAPTLAVRAAGGAAAPDGVVVNGDGDLVIPAGLALGELALEIVANDGEFDSERVVPITVTVEEPVDLSYTVPADGEIVIQLENRDGSITILDEDVDGGGVNNSDLTQFRDSANPETVDASRPDGLWPGFNGGGYLDMGGQVGDQATFDVTVATAGAYVFTFRYANGSAFNGGVRPLDIAVDGTVQATPDFARGVNAEGDPSSFGDWQDQVVTLTLEAGTSTISLTNTVENGPNIDQVTVAPAPLDEDPTALTIALIDVTENVAGADVATVAVADVDTVYAPTDLAVSDDRFELVAGDADNSFTLKLKAGEALDFEAAEQPTVTVSLGALSEDVTLAPINDPADDDTGVAFDPVTIQAEDAEITDVPGAGPGNQIVALTGTDTDAFGNTLGEDRTGFEGTGYVDYGNTVGDSAAFTVNVPAAGVYTATFRYANGDSVARPLDLTVNGQAALQVSFAPTVGDGDNWNAWTDVTVELTLTEGENVVALTIPTVANGGVNNGPNIDQVTFALKDGDDDVAEPGPRETIRINFQDPGSPTPEGYVAAVFEGFADQGNGLSYGFITEASALDEDGESNTPITPDLFGEGATAFPAIAINERDIDGYDPRLTGYVHFDFDDRPTYNGERVGFELALDNGWYEVTVAVGDTAGPNDSDNQLLIEGELVSSFIPTDLFKTQLVTTVVEVVDGHLTLAAPDGKITEAQYLEVRELPDLTPDDDRAAPEDYAQFINPVATAGINENRVEVDLDPASGTVEGVDPNSDIVLGVQVAPDRGGVLLESLTDGSIRLFNTLTGEEVPYSVNTTAGFDSLTISPSAPLEPFTSYTLVIDGFQDRGDANDLSAPSREFQKFSTTFTTGDAPEIVDREVAFADTLEFVGNPALGQTYTSIEMSPDGQHLYVSSIGGTITRWEVDPNDGSLIQDSIEVYAPEEFNQAGGRRGIIGLAFDPEDPETIWITDNYPIPLSGRDNGVPDFSGRISKVTLGEGGSLSDASIQTYVTGLPRSNGDHVTNSLEFRNVGTEADPEYLMYLIQGSNTAMGAPDSAWGFRPERLLNAAVMEIDHKRTDVPAGGFDVTTEPLPADGNNRRFADDDNDLFNGGIPIDSGEFSGNFLHFNENGVASVRVGADADSDLVQAFYDPFAEDAVVSIFATGQRNAYDLVWHSNGFLYVPTNGSAAGGNVPDDPRTPANEGRTGVERQDDYLFIIEEGAYSGHPNPLHGHYVLNGGNPTTGDDPNEVNAYGEGNVAPDPDYNPDRAYSLGPNRSPNGAIEYTSNVFGGSLQNALLFTEYSGGNDVRAILFDENGLPSEDFVLVNTDGQVINYYPDPLDIIEGADGRLYLLTLNRSNGQSQIVRLDPAPGGEVADTTADAGGNLTLLVVDQSDAAAVVFQVNGLDDDIETLTVDFGEGPQSITLDDQSRFTLDLSQASAPVTVTLGVEDEAGNTASAATQADPGASVGGGDPVFIDATEFTVLSTLTGGAATVIRNINDQTTHEPGDANDLNGDGLNDGYDGLAYLDPNGGPEDKAAFSFNAPAAGTYTFSFRMAANNDRDVTFRTGDASQTVTVNTGTFTNWQNSEVVLTLVAGLNTITISQPGPSGPNIDSVTITPLAIEDVTADAGDDLALAVLDASDPAAVVFQVSGDDDDIDAFTVSVDDAPGEAVTLDENGQFVLDLTAFADQSVVATLTVTDTAGNTAQAASAAFTPAFVDPAPDDGTALIDGVAYTLYEAENAALGGAVVVPETEDDRNAQGAGFVDFDGAGDQTITWTIEVPEDGVYGVDILYALASTKAARPMTLSVDGSVVDTLPFAPNSNAAENVWGPQSTSLELTAGVHQITVTAPGAVGPNVDQLRITSQPLVDPGDLTADEGGDLAIALLDATDPQAVAFQVTGLDDDIETVKIAFNSGDPVEVTVDENGQFIADVGLDLGAVDAVLTVTDDAGNSASADVAFAVAPDGDPNADIEVQSLDPAFFDNRLHFSFVQNSDGRLFKDSATVQLSNSGSEVLEIIGFEINGPFTLPEPTLDTLVDGLTIDPGATFDIEVLFNADAIDPKPTNGQNGVREGVLTLITNDAEDPFVSVDLAGFWQSQQEGGQEPNVNEVWQVFGFGNEIADLPFTGGGENSVLDFDDLYLAAPGQEGVEILSPYWRLADGVTEARATIIAAYNASGSAGLGIHNPGNKGQDVGLTAWGGGGGAQSQSILPLTSGGSFATTLFSDATIPDGWLGDDIFGIEMAGLSTDPSLNSSGGGTPSQSALDDAYGAGAFTVTGTGANAVVTDAEGNVVEDGYTVRMFQALDADGVPIPNVYLGIMDYTGINYDYNDNMFIFEGIAPVGFGNVISIEGLDDAAADDRLVFSRIDNPANGQEVRDSATFQVTNDGFVALEVVGLSFGGANPDAFELADPSQADGFTVAPGQSVDVTVNFVGTDPANDGAAVSYAAELVIESDDALNPTSTVALAGLAQIESQGGEEPTVAEIFAAFGYTTDIAQDQLNNGGLVETVGDEILAPYLQALDPSAPVEVIQIAAYQQANAARFGVHGLQGEPVTQLFTQDGDQYQAILPDGDGPGGQARASFSPTSPFGVYISVEGNDAFSAWSDPEANERFFTTGTAGSVTEDGEGHLIRYFEAKDANGEVIEGVYLGFQDYPGAGNFDYNDYLFVIKNVQPYALTAEETDENGVNLALVTDTDTDGVVDFFDDDTGGPVGGDEQTPFPGPNAPTFTDGVLTVDATNFDAGGQNVSYFDVDPGQQGGSSNGRPGTDVETVGGQDDIAFVAPGEWLEFTVTVPAAGVYAFSVVAKSPIDDATIALSIEDGPSLGVITLPDANAAGNDSFTGTDFAATDPVEVTLPAGEQTLRLTLDGGSTADNGYVLDLRSFTLEALPGDEPSDQSPFPGPDAPGFVDGALTLAALNYDNGGQNVAYLDAPGLQGGSTGGRPGSDVEVTAAGDVGWIADGEWLEYTIEVDQAGLYDLDLILSTAFGGRSATVAFYRDGEVQPYVSSAPIDNPNTGGFTTFAPRSATGLALEAGAQQMRVTFAGGSQDFRSFTLTLSEPDDPSGNQPPVTEGIADAQADEGEAFTLDVSGQFSDQDVEDELVFTATGLPAGLTISDDGVITGAPTETGTFTVSVTASDGDAEVTTDFELSVAPGVVGDAQAPFPGPNAPSFVDGALTVSAANFDAGGQGVSWNDDPGSDGGLTAFRPGADVEFVGAPGAPDIGYVENGEWLEYTVNVPASGLYNLSVTAKTPIGGNTISVSLGAGAVLATFVLADANAPDNVSFTGTEFSETPAQSIALEAGEQTLRFTFEGAPASNGYLLDFRSFSLEQATPEEPVNQAPVAEGVADAEADEGQAFSLDVSDQFSDPDVDDVLTFTASGLPSGLTISPEGVISGQPTESGAFTVSVTASDGDLSVSSDFVLSVEPAPTPPEQGPFPGPNAPGFVDGALTVSAGDFDNGGQGVSWNDNPGRDGGVTTFRPGVDVEVVGSASQPDIGYVENGEWVEYTITVPESGLYDLSLVAKTPVGGNTISVSVGDAPALATFALEDGNAADNNAFGGGTDFLATPSQTVALEAGQQTLRFTFDGAPATNGYLLDFRSFTLEQTPTEPEARPVAQAGSQTIFQSGPDVWTRVLFDEELENPSVVAGPLTSNGSDPAMVRIRDVTSTGFEMQLDEWDYLDGSHIPETVSWFAVSEGVHDFGDGLVIEAGSTMSDEGLGDVDFLHAFDAAPVVVAQVASDANPEALVTRLDAVDADGFSVKVSDEEASTANLVDEIVSWIAVTPGVFDGLQAGVTGETVTSDEYELVYDQSPADGFIGLIASMQTFNGGNPAGVRLADPATASSASIFIEEEQSLDEEVDHIAEEVGWIVLGEDLFA